jgi:hypothetical protein
VANTLNLPRNGAVGCIAWLDVFGLAAESKVIPVRIDSHKISHAVWIIFGVRLHDSAILFDLCAVIVDLIAQNISRAAANGSFVNAMS